MEPLTPEDAAKLKPYAEAYHAANASGDHLTEFRLRIAAAERVMPQAGIDPGHLAAINVAYNRITDGKLGMTVDEAKEYTAAHKK